MKCPKCKIEMKLFNNTSMHNLWQCEECGCMEIEEIKPTPEPTTAEMLLYICDTKARGFTDINFSPYCIQIFIKDYDEDFDGTKIPLESEKRFDGAEYEELIKKAYKFAKENRDEQP